MPPWVLLFVTLFLMVGCRRLSTVRLVVTCTLYLLLIERFTVLSFVEIHNSLYYAIIPSYQKSNKVLHSNYLGLAIQSHCLQFSSIRIVSSIKQRHSCPLSLAWPRSIWSDTSFLQYSDDCLGLVNHSWLSIILYLIVSTSTLLWTCVCYPIFCFLSFFPFFFLKYLELETAHNLAHHAFV